LDCIDLPPSLKYLLGDRSYRLAITVFSVTSTASSTRLTVTGIAESLVQSGFRLPPPTTPRFWTVFLGQVRFRQVQRRPSMPSMVDIDGDEDRRVSTSSAVDPGGPVEEGEKKRTLTPPPPPDAEDLKRENATPQARWI